MPSIPSRHSLPPSVPPCLHPFLELADSARLVLDPSKFSEGFQQGILPSPCPPRPNQPRNINIVCEYQGTLTCQTWLNSGEMHLPQPKILKFSSAEVGCSHDPGHAANDVLVINRGRLVLDGMVTQALTAMKHSSYPYSSSKHGRVQSVVPPQTSQAS